MIRAFSRSRRWICEYPRKPDLDRLVTALTADGRPDELTGREAAVAAFRAGGRDERPTGRPGGGVVSIRRPFTALRPAAGRRRRRRGRRRGGRRGGLRAGAARPGARPRAHRVRAARRPRLTSLSPATRPPLPSRRPAGVRAGQSPPEKPRRLRRGREAANLITVAASRRARAGTARGSRSLGGHRLRARRGRGAGPAVRTARRSTQLEAGGHRGNRAAGRVQAAEPAPDGNRRLPGGRARCRAQRSGAGRGRRPGYGSAT